MTTAQLSFWQDDLAQAMGISNPAKELYGLDFGLAPGLGLQPSDVSEAAVLSLVPAGCSRTEVALELNA